MGNIRARVAVPLAALLLASRAKAGEASALEREAEGLSERWAPSFVQAVASDRPEQDRPLRVDFDGDWDATNNWRDLTPAATASRASVYTSTILSETHAFLTYTLFYPRDWVKPFCVPYVCHDNDLETLLVVAERGDHGKLVMVETKAHNGYYARPGDELARDAAGRPLLRVESQGHGIYSLARDERSHGRSLRLVPPGAERETGAERYDLISLRDTLWSRRAASAENDRLWIAGESGFLGYRGARLGRLGGLLGASMAQSEYPGGVRPPWALQAPVGERGDWFLDPAYVTTSRHAELFSRDSAAPSLRYVWNPFADDLRHECAATNCPPVPVAPVSLASRFGLGSALLALVGLVSLRYPRRVVAGWLRSLRAR